MTAEVNKSSFKCFMWSYTSGFVAGMGSAMGALAFPQVAVSELGAAIACICGVVAAAGAIYVFNKKIERIIPAAAVLGFISPPALVVIFFMQPFVV